MARPGRAAAGREKTDGTPLGPLQRSRRRRWENSGGDPRGSSGNVETRSAEDERASDVVKIFRGIVKCAGASSTGRENTRAARAGERHKCVRNTSG